MTPSPESRLLDLIRKKSGPSLKDRGMAWLKKTLNWVDKSSVDSDAFWLWANGCLALTLAGTLIYAGFVFLSRENPARPERSEAPLTFSEAQRVERKPPPSDLTRRDLFKDMAPPPPPPPVVEIPAGPPPPPKIPLSDRASRFRLVGIIPGEKPQAIIEDTQTQRTLYATQGQRLDGILVESVTAGKVVLSDGEERVDLTL